MGMSKDVPGGIGARNPDQMGYNELSGSLSTGLGPPGTA